MKIVVAVLLAFVSLGRAADAASPIVVSDAWSRPAIDTGVVYATLVNTGDEPDRLDRVQTAVAKAAELHRSMAMAAMKGMPDTGVMSMQPVASIGVPAHGAVKLAPGGNHVMLIGLRHELHVDQTFVVRLHLVRAGWTNVRVTVRPL